MNTERHALISMDSGSPISDSHCQGFDEEFYRIVAPHTRKGGNQSAEVNPTWAKTSRGSRARVLSESVEKNMVGK